MCKSEIVAYLLLCAVLRGLLTAGSVVVMNIAIGWMLNEYNGTRYPNVRFMDPINVGNEGLKQDIPQSMGKFGP